MTHAITEARIRIAAQAGDQKKPKPYRSKWEKACKFEVIPTDESTAGDQKKPKPAEGPKRTKGRSPEKLEEIESETA